MGERKRRSWWLNTDNYQALADESKRRGIVSDNAMLNEIVREWREMRLNQNDATLMQLPCTPKQ